MEETLNEIWELMNKRLTNVRGEEEREDQREKRRKAEKEEIGKIRNKT